LSTRAEVRTNFLKTLQLSLTCLYYGEGFHDMLAALTDPALLYFVVNRDHAEHRNSANS